MNENPNLEQNKKFDELTERNADNPLFKNNFENIPENFVSIYHYAEMNNIESIGKLGLHARFKEKFATDAIKSVDLIFDKYAPPGFSRSSSFYAYPNEKGRGMFSDGERIKLEIKVDPKRVRVGDLGMVTVAAERPNEAEEWARVYWESSVTLEEFLLKNTYIPEPEVIIPFDIDPVFIRAIPD